MSELVLRHVTKIYPGGVRAVSDASLAIAPGEFMVLVGPSGCGKSTLMRMIAGLEDVSEGTIEIGGRDVTSLSPRDRDIAMVFQNYALYPHMTVRKNLGYGLRMRKTPREEITRRVDEVAKMLGLDELLERRPAALSGGQRQRVAMGRAIVREPQVFLLDEPLSNLDAMFRVGMRAQLARLHERLRITTVYVTHDQVEAMTLGERVAVLRDGVLQQVDTPQNLYARPCNVFVATFLGSPSMNLVSAVIDGGAVTFAGISIPLHPGNTPAWSGPVILGMRPHDFEDVAFGTAGLPTIEVTVSLFEELGSEHQAIFALDVPPVAVGQAVTNAAEEATLIADERETLLTACVDARSSARRGDRVTLTLDHSRFHFFDPATGLTLAAAGEPVPA